MSYATTLLKVAIGFAMVSSVHAEETEWRAAMIKDALSAAPPAVTNDAEIYAWKSQGKLVKLREGTGAYKCVASGAFGVRIGKPDLPFPDPMCLDANAWAFMSATWKEKNPLKPATPYPTAPGLVWMLAGMSSPSDKVTHADNPNAQFRVVDEGNKIVRLSPHIMVMPLPVNGMLSLFDSQYDTKNPGESWVMAAGTPAEHLMIHFSEAEADEIMWGSSHILHGILEAESYRY